MNSINHVVLLHSYHKWKKPLDLQEPRVLNQTMMHVVEGTLVIGFPSGTYCMTLSPVIVCTFTIKCSICNGFDVALILWNIFCLAKAIWKVEQQSVSKEIMHYQVVTSWVSASFLVNILTVCIHSVCIIKNGSNIFNIDHQQTVFSATDLKYTI